MAVLVVSAWTDGDMLHLRGQDLRPV